MIFLFQNVLHFLVVIGTKRNFYLKKKLKFINLKDLLNAFLTLNETPYYNSPDMDAPNMQIKFWFDSLGLSVKASSSSSDILKIWRKKIFEEQKLKIKFVCNLALLYWNFFLFLFLAIFPLPLPHFFIRLKFLFYTPNRLFKNLLSEPYFPILLSKNSHF